MKSVLVGIIAVMASCAPLVAQTPTISGLKVDISRVSPAGAVATTTIPFASITCDLAASPANAPVVNPGIVEFQDPSRPTRVCRGSIGAVVAALPPADYTAVGQFIYSDPAIVGGVSSASSPFSRFDPQTPLQLRIVR